ncbi:MAG: replication-relaxation family protein [Dehalococcoidia bacterium]|nr:replication-relaxation family protein [Dehalococcoidia bacterium]
MATERNLQLEAVDWLTRLPFLGADELSLLLGVTKPPAARTLGELENLGWVEWVTPSSPELDPERLYALTGSSLGRVAEHTGLTGEDLARSLPLERKEVMQRLTRLETTVGLNLFASELVAAARDDIEVELEDIRSLPWGRRPEEAWWPPEVEGYGCLRWGAWRAPFFVAWDRAGAPPFHRRKRVAAWYAFWNAEHAWGRDDIPSILVLHRGAEEAEQWAGAVLRASDRRQVAALHVFLGDAECALSEGPLGAVWRRPDGSARAHLCERLVWRLTIPPAAAAIRIGDPARPLEALSRDGPSLREWATQAVPSEQKGWAARGGQERLAALSLVTNTTEKRILEWLGHHPLLSADDLAVILRVAGQLPARLLDNLARYGLVESTDKALEIEAAPPRRYYLAGLGLKLLAARDGVPPRRYARHGIVAASMPGKKGGGRLSTLLRQLDHTVGVNRFFVRLIRDGAKGGPRLVRWLSASEAAQRFTYGDVTHWLRPDGAGDVHYEGRVRRFYLEWDRGTVKLPDLMEKCRLYAAYYAYLARTGIAESLKPSALVVTSSPPREGVLWRAIVAAFDEVKASPCYFFTTVDTLIGRAGPLASVWRTLKSDERVSWYDFGGRSP